MSPRPDHTRRGAIGFHGFRIRLLVIGLAALVLTAFGIFAVVDPDISEADGDVQVTRPADRPLRVLFVGDSISYGLNAEVQDLGFRPLMVDALAQDGPVQEFHKNRADATTRTVSRLVDVPENLDLAVVELGTNDVLEHTAPDEFALSYRSLLERVHTESPGVPLICVGTWGTADESDTYNDIIDSECDREGGAVVSLYDLYPIEANRSPAGRDVFGGTSDRFHPNDSGYRAIAKLLLAQICIR